MIKLVVITDIHGNGPALTAALQDISSRGVDHIYCMGDVVGIGPDSNEVLDLLLSPLICYCRELMFHLLGVIMMKL